MVQFINVKYSELEKSIEAESKIVVARGWRVRMEWCSMVIGFLLGVMRRFENQTVVMVTHHHE